MFKKLILLSFVTTILLSTKLNAQTLTQTIRGTITDKVTNQPLPGATVVLLNSEPLSGASADADGNFRITRVPVGKQALKITFLGYKEQTIPNIVVNSGKEVVLNIQMEEDYVMAKEVVIIAKTEKEKPLNELAAVSARTFSVEETQKFAAAVNDPARMASSFAGVISADDGNNNISIRGNAPNGLLWRMEGVEIPNPNHFSSPGSAGGGISILSAQLMANSDFLTGAFPAEYGNALSGVFDIRLRKGNNEHNENTIQAGVLGIDVATEGPFSKNYKGSYLINYRYSTLSLLSKIGVNVGEGITNFQDLSYNFYLPTKKFGNFTIFGFGGLSTQSYDAQKDSTKWKVDDERYNSKFFSNTGATGITHSIILGDNTWLKSAFVASVDAKGFKAEKLDNAYNPEVRYDDAAGQNKFTFNSTLNHKFNSRHSIRAGVNVNRIDFDINYKEYDQDLNAVVNTIDTHSFTYNMQLFAQSSYHLTEKILLNGGLSYSRLFLNSTQSVEPRASVKYELFEKQYISLGYGLHSQLQPVGIYFAKAPGSNGSPNKNLEMSKAHHIVLSYDRMLSESLHLKTEFYYQSLFNIPVRSDIENSFSVVNTMDGYVTDPLVNKGTGRNYGTEITLEQFMKKNFYYLLSASLYDSKYKGSDGVMRNTRYNCSYAASFTAGKEFMTGKKFKNRVIGINIKTIYRGGFRDTPIDLAASQSQVGDGTVYHDDQAFSIKYPDYFRTDFRISMKRNREHSTHTFALDIQNVSNTKNIYGRYFNEETNSIKTYYQAPLIPILSYKIEF